MAGALTFAGIRLHVGGSGSVASVRPRAVAESGARSPYEVLRVRETATAGEIKTAYRSMAKLFHPDVAPRVRGGGEHDFVEIHRAYEALLDPAARARYDLSVGKRRRPGAAGLAEAGPPLRSSRWETDQCW